MARPKRPSSSSTAEPGWVTTPPPAENPIKPRRCAWTTYGAVCRLLEEGWDTLGPTRTPDWVVTADGLCAWHSVCRASSSRSVDSYEAFVEWVVPFAATTCSQWSHHPPAYLWEALRGLDRPIYVLGVYEPPACRWLAQPCASPRCWVHDVLVRDGFACDLRAPGIPRRQAVRAVIEMLTRAMDVHQEDPV